MLTYEAKLAENLERAFQEGSMHFNEKSAVHVSLRKMTSKLKDLGIPYAVVGGMALFAHGVRRFTVVELIKTLKLPVDFAQKVNPYARDKFMELWIGVQGGP